MIMPPFLQRVPGQALSDPADGYYEGTKGHDRQKDCAAPLSGPPIKLLPTWRALSRLGRDHRAEGHWP